MLNGTSFSVSQSLIFGRVKNWFRVNWFEAACLLALAVVLIWRGHSFVFSGDSTSSAAVLTSSVIIYVLVFVLAEFFLRRQGVGYERFFVAVACVVAGIWLQQGLYHFGFAQARMPSAVASTLFTLNFNFNTSAATYPLYWNLIMISLPFAAYKYMRLNRYLVLTALIGGGIYLLWIYAGYPQFFAPSWFPSSPVALPLVSGNSAAVKMSGYIFNSAFTIVAFLPALLFYKKQEANSSAPKTS